MLHRNARMRAKSAPPRETKILRQRSNPSSADVPGLSFRQRRARRPGSESTRRTIGPTVLLLFKTKTETDADPADAAPPDRASPRHFWSDSAPPGVARRHLGVASTI